MPIDHYAPCPCGSGKKLKFCKCVENLQDLEKVVRLIEGGQDVAALDRINQLLKKTPNTAWLLAIKGELTLGMQEVDSFRETANRFLKLKPDNPLALIMRSIVASIDGEPHEQAARYLLQGMAESRESLPALAITAIQMLMRSLAAVGKLSMVGYWADVYAALVGDQGSSEDSALLDPDLNLLAKSPSKIIEDPPGSQWKERLAEVLVLARSFRYEQAEKKLQSILRDFPGQPGPLSHLLRAQYAQLDQLGAMETARKLSNHLEVPAADRAYFAALALELEPERKSLQAPMHIQYGEIDSEERVNQLMLELDYADAPNDESLQNARQYFAYLVKDEVPAKRIFNLFDRALKPAASEATEPAQVTSLVGTVVLFGKQTDRPARCLLMANRLPGNQARVQELLDQLQIGAPFGDEELPLSSHYVEVLQRPRFLAGQPQASLSPQQFGDIVVEEFLHLPIQCLNQQTPLEAVQDESQRALVLGLLNHLEGEQSLVMEASAIDTLYERLQLERPRVEVNRQAESLRLVNILDLERIRIEDISPQQLKGLLVRAVGLGALRVAFRCSKAVVDTTSLADDHQMQVLALSNLIATASSFEERLDASLKLEQAMLKSKNPVGRVILQRLGILHAMGREEEGQQLLMESLSKYPEDPYLMSFVQYAMQSQGGGGMPAQDPGQRLAQRMQPSPGRAASPEADSGLVLPGQERGPAGGESKLWLPGS